MISTISNFGDDPVSAPCGGVWRLPVEGRPPRVGERWGLPGAPYFGSPDFKFTSNMFLVSEYVL